MERGRVSDEAVKKTTGKTWDEWFSILDTAGAKRMNHTEIAHLISTRHISNGWWAQMVAVEYERLHRKRKVTENKDGFMVTVHRTVSLPVKKLERAWETILKSKHVARQCLVRIPSTKRQMLRYKADVGGVRVSFDARGSGKSRIAIESTKLPSKKFVEQHRLYWKKVLAALG
jgi:hypothetical protein